MLSARSDASHVTPAQLKVTTALFAAAVVIGIVLRCIQYFAATSLWLDELALANNLPIHSLLELVSAPLDYAQMAPAGFVAFEKIVSMIFGPSELSLRFWSLVMGCAAVVLSGLATARIAGRAFAWVVALMVALAPDLIWQSAQVKPYSGDVALTLLVVWLTLRDFDNGARRPSHALTAACVLAPWFSFAALFAVAAAGIAWFARAQFLKNTTDVAATRITVVAWALACMAVAAIARGQLSPETDAVMQDYWGGGFAPDSAGLGGLAVWTVDTLAKIVREVSGGVGRVMVLVTVAGALVLAWRSWTHALALCVPLLLALLAAALSLYPMAERTALWAGPFLLILAVAALATIARAITPQNWSHLALVAPAVLIALPLRATVARPPAVRHVQEMKSVLAHIAEHEKPGDAVYVYFTAWHAATFYRALLDRPALTVAQGTCSPADRLRPLREIDALRGHRRVWIVFSHVDPLHRDIDLVLGYMGAIGVQRDVFAAPAPFPGGSTTSSTVLYEFDATKAATVADASRWQVPADILEAPVRACLPIFAPTRLLQP